MILAFRRQQVAAGPPAFVFYDVDIVSFLVPEPPAAVAALPWIQRVEVKLSSWYGKTVVKAAD